MILPYAFNNNKTKEFVGCMNIEYIKLLRKIAVRKMPIHMLRTNTEIVHPRFE